MHFRLSKLPYYLTHIDMYAHSLYHLRKWHAFERWMRRQKNKGMSVALVNGGAETYLFDINDRAIPYDMFVSKRVYSEDDIRFFFEMTEKYYSKKPSDRDIFLDIGANIGTTSIYVQKNIQRMETIAFEPDPYTYRILTINCLINECDAIKPVNLALSNERCTRKMLVSPKNRGANRIVEENETSDANDERERISIDTVTLDAWIQEKAIDQDRIAFLWIDAEGHEPQIIEGMENLLSRGRIPIFMEFNLGLYSKENLMKMEKIFAHSYDKVIAVCVSTKEIREIPVENMRQFGENEKEQWNIFLY